MPQDPPKIPYRNASQPLEVPHHALAPVLDQALVEAVYETRTPVVVVQVGGRPLGLSWIHEHVPALLEAWLPGEAKKVSFELAIDPLGFYDIDMNFVVEPGTVEVMVGSSSADIRLSGKREIVGEKTKIGKKVFASVARVL